MSESTVSPGVGAAARAISTVVSGASATAVRGVPRLLTTARNVAEVARFGGLVVEEEASPFEVVAERSVYRLRHYFPTGGAATGRPVVLVPPLMQAAEVWDVSTATSAVARLHGAGLDPWVLDFGDPAREPGGRHRTLTDHVLAVSDAVDRVYGATGRDVVLGGYSQGGMFCYQTAALRRGEHVDSLVTFGSPADTRAPLPIPLSPAHAAQVAAELVDTGLLRHLTLPSWSTRLGFKLLSPTKTLQARLRFLMALHDREALVPRERQRRFVESDGWAAYAGPAIAELLEQFVAHNRMLSGGFVIGDRLVTLADIEVPVLSVVGMQDTIAHPEAVRAIRRAAPRAQVYELTSPAGHFGLVVGSVATSSTWPAVIDWCRWRDGGGELPTTIVPAELVPPARVQAGTVASAVTQATDLGVGLGRMMASSARRAVRVTRAAVTETPVVLSRLSRLDRLEPGRRISLARLLDERAAENPREVCFVFGDRAHRYGEVKSRVDAVVKGLISVGIRHGDRVGVLMSTRPSAFVAIAALSRIGATAVLLRPDGRPGDDADRAGVSCVLTDPEHCDVAMSIGDVGVAVLGAAAGGRRLPDGAVDLERIDPDLVELPAWYRPNPHLAADIGVVVFTGRGADTRSVEITNRRWAMSALGTASAANLRPGDTVYGTAPLHHSSALLVSVAGAIASGARFAMATTSDPDTFWAEVRRYGVTHVCYTWASLRDVVEGPATPSERHHPIRMFIGSGMPANLWRRVVERFPGTTVVEFYASAETDVTLANLAGDPIGSLGTPLPGAAEVRVAAFDVRTRRIELGADGLARECEPDEVGLLVSRVNPEACAGARLRGLFEPGDAWISTGDLFRRDEHGRLWMVDPVSTLVRTARAVVSPGAARLAVETIPSVDLAVAYGVPERGAEVVVVAIMLRPGNQLTADELDRALQPVPLAQRPRYVHVVASIPMTGSSRPRPNELRATGVARPAESAPVWRLERSGRYRLLPVGKADQGEA